MLVLAGLAGSARTLAQDATPIAQTEVTPIDAGDTSTTTGDVTSDETASTPDESTPEATASGISPASVVVDPDPQDPPTVGDPVTVTIYSYLCATDPGSSDPIAAGCSVAVGASYLATDSNGLNATQATDGSGSTSFTSATGASFDVIQQASAVLNGYAARGDGHFEVQSLQGDMSLTFINVVKNQLGRIQLVAGLCPTTQENRTEWTTNQPNTFGAAAINSCGPNAGAIFTISSSALSEGSWAVRIEADGSWRGYVPSGDYTVTAPDGASTGLTVAPDRVGVAVAITYVNEGTGTLLIENYLCSQGTDGESIEVNPSGAPDASCAPAGTTAYVTDVAVGDATPIVVAQNGSTATSLKPGDYNVSSQSGAVSTTVSVTAGATTTVRLLTVAAVGAMSVQAYACPAGVTPATYADFIAQCTDAWTGKTLTITPDAGVPFTLQTNGSGGAGNNAVEPGAYSLGGSSVCGIFAGGSDASFGFDVVANQTTSLEVFGCFSDDDGTGGTGGSGGNGDGTGNENPAPNSGGGNIGGDGTGIPNSSNNLPYSSNSASAVTALPNTGSGNGDSLPIFPMALFLAAAIVGGIGFGLRRRAL